jgi:uncharacterized protein (TIGR02271 family)
MTDTTTGGGESRPRTEEVPAEVIRHEEEPRVDAEWEVTGAVGARRAVEHEQVRKQYPREFERLTQERVPVTADDSGQIETLPDGSVSIPLFEEELEVTRKTVLRERVIIRKELATDWQVVQAELRRERVEIDTRGLPPGYLEGGEALQRPGFRQTLAATWHQFRGRRR